MIVTMTPTHGVCLAAADEHILQFGLQARPWAGKHQCRELRTAAIMTLMPGICLTATDELVWNLVNMESIDVLLAAMDEHGRLWIAANME